MTEPSELHTQAGRGRRIKRPVRRLFLSDDEYWQVADRGRSNLNLPSASTAFGASDAIDAHRSCALHTNLVHRDPGLFSPTC